MSDVRYEPGDAVCVDLRQLRRDHLPVLREVGSSQSLWLAGIVDSVRADGWMLIRVAALGEADQARSLVVAPPDAVRQPRSDGSCG